MKKKNFIKYAVFTFMLFLTNSLIVVGANEYIVCGDGYIPKDLAPVSRTIVAIFQIVLPLVIIIMGSLDFVKAVVANDQEAIKKNQHQFLNRLKQGAIFFFVVVLVKFVVSIVADSSDEYGSISECIDCMISDEGSCGAVTTVNPFKSN